METPRYECCRGCGLWQGCNSWKIDALAQRQGKGYPGSNIPLLILDNYPSREDDEYNRPFSGDIERFLRTYLDYLEFDWIFDNSVRCYPNGKPTPKQRKSCEYFTVKRIEGIKPKVILCLGLDACQNLLGSVAPKSIAQARANPIDYNGTWVITTYHPLNHVMEPRRMDLVDEYKRVFLLVEQILKDEYVVEEVEYTALFEDAAIVEWYNQNTCGIEVAIDVEVAIDSQDPRRKTIWHPDSSILTVSFTFHAKGSYNTLVIDCTTTNWERWVREFCKGRHVIGHNIKFDAQAINIFSKGRVNLFEIAAGIDDTLHQHYLRDQSKIGNSLKTLANQIFGAPDWSQTVWRQVDEARAKRHADAIALRATNKKRVKQGLEELPIPLETCGFEVVDRDELMKYNAHDTYYTAKLQFDSRALGGLENAITKTQCYFDSMCQVRMLYYMEQTGLFISRPKQLDLETAYKRKRLEIEHVLNKISEVIQTGQEVNTKSPNFMKALLQTTNCSVDDYTKQGAPKIDKAALKKLAGIDPKVEPHERSHAQKIWNLVFYNRQHRDALSKFVSPYLDYMVDGPIEGTTVIHSTYSNVKVEMPGRSAGADESGGAESGRVASYDPNMHNIKKDNVLRLPYDAPPGYSWWEFDQSTIEPRTNAWLADCENLKEIFRGGTDLYLRTANDAWELGHDPKVLFKGYPGISSKVRDDTKIGFLAITYDLQPETWHHRYKNPMEQIEAFFEGFYKKNPELLLKSNAVKDRVFRGLPVVSPNGRTRSFPLSQSYPGWRYEEYKLVPFYQYARELRITSEDQHILRESYNFIIQGFSSDMNCKVAEFLDYRGPHRGCFHPALKKFGTKVLHSNIVHDSLWMLIHNSVGTQVAPIIRQIATKDLYTYLSLKYGWDVPLEIEAKYGPNLGSMKTYVFAEV